MNDERIFINNFLNMIQIYETRLMIKLFFYIDFEI